MTCGSCSFTDKLCYCSIPPQVKCTITNEFHYYDDECNCEEAMASREEELECIKRKFSEPGALMAINYDGLNAPSVAIGSFDASVDHIEINPDGCLPVVATTTGATSCLACGESIQIEGWWESYQKICPTCQKAIKFIKEKFSKELETYEV